MYTIKINTKRVLALIFMIQTAPTAGLVFEHEKQKEIRRVLLEKLLIIKHVDSWDAELNFSITNWKGKEPVD